MEDFSRNLLDTFLFTQAQKDDEDRNEILGALRSLYNNIDMNKSINTLQRHFPGVVLKNHSNNIYLDMMYAILQQWAREDLQNRWALTPIGEEGGYGKLLMGIHGDQTIARKINKIQYVDQSFLRELGFLNFMKSLNCPYLISYQGYSITSESVFIDMEYLPMDLSKAQERGLIDVHRDIKSIAFQLFAGIAFMHKYRFCHCDLKTQNVLYDPEQRQIKIIDFGLIQPICDPEMEFEYEVSQKLNSNSILGNYYQVPPEALICNDDQDNCGITQKQCFNSSVDIWNVGLILVDLLGFPPDIWVEGYDEDEAANTFTNVVSQLGAITREEWNANNFNCSQIPLGSAFDTFDSFDDAADTMWTHLEGMYENDQSIMLLIDLLKRCVTATPRNRIYARHALQHPFFQGAHIPTRYTEYWSADDFLEQRFIAAPPPLLERRFMSMREVSARMNMCQRIQNEYGAEMACTIIYMYDSHCWMQAQQMRVQQKYNFFYPDGFEQVGKILCHYEENRYDHNVMTFIEYVTPARLIGISFLQYAYIRGYTNAENVLNRMCHRNFVFETYEQNFDILE